jgi:uncharacterized protein
MSAVQCQVEELFVYPFKSGRGIPKQDVRVGDTGLEWDRHWMAVDAAGKFLSQRTHPKLAQLVTEIAEDSLVLRGAELPPLTVPLRAGDQRPVAVRVWDDDCAGLDQGDEAARWLSTFLGQELRMVRVIPQPQRLANPKYAGSDPKPVTFVDGFQILVCNRASLEELNMRMPEPIPMNRFRPNIVLGGLEPFAEDRIARLRIGELTLQLVKPCTRCVITATDQQTGQPATNPLPVLRTFRLDRTLLGVTFGENAVVVAGSGSTLRRGCRVEVTFEP